MAGFPAISLTSGLSKLNVTVLFDMERFMRLQLLGGRHLAGSSTIHTQEPTAVALAALGCDAPFISVVYFIVDSSLSARR